MTDKQKARAYDEALERARKIHDEILNNELIGFPGQLREIFPELTESEDERIRKFLIDILSSGVWRPEWPFSPIDCVAYLEKQKEQIPIPDKFSGLKSLMLQYLQSAANRKDDTEIESDTDLWGRKILDYVWKYSDIEKQKEQSFTHHEINESLRDAVTRQMEDDGDVDDFVRRGIDDIALRYAALGAEWQKEQPEVKDPFDDEQFRRGYEAGKNDAIRMSEMVLYRQSWYMEGYHDKEFNMEPKWTIKAEKGGPRYYENPNYGKPLEPKEQKPTWSEEDELHRKSIISTIEMCMKDNDSAGYVLGYYDSDIAWLKSLSERFELESKQEWSEADEGMLNCIIATLCDESHGGRETNDKMVTWLDNRLKSLRPSTSDYKVGDKLSWKGKEYTIDKVVCYDNRFEIIDRAKQDLLDKTNIADSPDEMAALYNFLFRCWQMGWLKKYEDNANEDNTQRGDAHHRDR